MKTWMVGASFVLALGMVHGALADQAARTGGGTGSAQNVPPDNTGKNERDRNDVAVTPMDQSNDPADLELTQKIRKAVVADDGLSTNAQNVKIIAAEGVVTLRGPVNSADEKAKVEATAERIAGAKNVRSQLEVAAQ
jgi:hyperosmotically inducible protein